jgi:hypothetical protein
MTKEQEYLDKLIQEIEIAKTQHRNGIYKIREKMNDSTAIYVKNYLITHTPYRIEFRKCPSCSFEWDIMIIF